MVQESDILTLISDFFKQSRKGALNSNKITATHFHVTNSHAFVAVIVAISHVYKDLLLDYDTGGIQLNRFRITFYLNCFAYMTLSDHRILIQIYQIEKKSNVGLVKLYLIHRSENKRGVYIFKINSTILKDCLKNLFT